MIFRFKLVTGEIVETPRITQQMLNDHGDPKGAVDWMLDHFKQFKDLTYLKVEGCMYNPQNIVWMEHADHEWLKELWPDLEWWDNE